MSAANQIRLTTLLALLVALACCTLPAAFHKRWLNRVLLVFSAACVLYFTVFAKVPGSSRTYNLLLFWNYRRWSQVEVRHEIIQNMLLFMPLGASMRAVRARYPVGIAAVTSAAVELCQYLFGLGLAELDDVVHNTLGAALGVLVLWAAEHYVPLLREKLRKQK